LILSTLATAAAPSSWVTYRNDKFGFAITVPMDVFVAGTPRNSTDGNLWISRDGQARLLAVAARNETGESLESYRSFVMKESYAKASFDYAPVRDNWFVLSGTKGNQLFYERITFACDGRYIYGWQMFYPASEKRMYERIIEAIHKSYQAGNGEDGNCG
jgi:serine/threonine-protein kinase